MASNVNMIDKNTDTATKAEKRATEGLNNVTSKVGDLVHEGVNAVRGQIETVRNEGIHGVRRDVTDYARNQPVKALLVAGGIGALAALIFSRR